MISSRRSWGLIELLFDGQGLIGTGIVLDEDQATDTDVGRESRIKDHKRGSARADPDTRRIVLVTLTIGCAESGQSVDWRTISLGSIPNRTTTHSY